MPIKNAQAADPKPVVMVIEPEVLVRMVIAEFLRECGFKVIEGILAEDVRTVTDVTVGGMPSTVRCRFSSAAVNATFAPWPDRFLIEPPLGTVMPVMVRSVVCWPLDTV